MPTAADPAAAAFAPAVVEAVASWVACRVIEPVASSTSSAAVPRRASVVMLEMMMAIAGVTATPPPPPPPPPPEPPEPPDDDPVAFAPIRASTEATVRADAVRVMSRAPVTATPSSMRLSTSSVTSARPNATPMPTLSPLTPSSAGRAVTVTARSEAEVAVRSPPVSSTVP